MDAPTPVRPRFVHPDAIGSATSNIDMFHSPSAGYTSPPAPRPTNGGGLFTSMYENKMIVIFIVVAIIVIIIIAYFLLKNDKPKQSTSVATHYKITGGGNHDEYSPAPVPAQKTQAVAPVQTPAAAPPPAQPKMSKQNLLSLLARVKDTPPSAEPMPSRTDEEIQQMMEYASAPEEPQPKADTVSTEDDPTAGSNSTAAVGPADVQSENVTVDRRLVSQVEVIAFLHPPPTESIFTTSDNIVDRIVELPENDSEQQAPAEVTQPTPENDNRCTAIVASGRRCLNIARANGKCARHGG